MKKYWFTICKHLKHTSVFVNTFLIFYILKILEGSKNVSDGFLSISERLWLYILPEHLKQHIIAHIYLTASPTRLWATWEETIVFQCTKVPSMVLNTEWMLYKHLWSYVPMHLERTKCSSYSTFTLVSFS